MTFAGMNVFFDELLGKPVTPPFPKLPKGPYLKRRYKRWRLRHPTYYAAAGRVIINNRRRSIFCHPDDWRTIERAVSLGREIDEHVFQEFGE